MDQFQIYWLFLLGALLVTATIFQRRKKPKIVAPVRDVSSYITVDWFDGSSGKLLPVRYDIPEYLTLDHPVCIYLGNAGTSAVVQVKQKDYRRIVAHHADTVAIIFHDFILYLNREGYHISIVVDLVSRKYARKVDGVVVLDRMPALSEI